jgi:diguanylate cyclase (GGDEF)-like protein
MKVAPDHSRKLRLDLSPRSWMRVVLLTTLGTLCCIAVAFIIDSHDWETGAWRWGTQPLNNLIIPLLLAPPFFVYLLNKQRQLAIAHHELMVVAATDPLTSCLNRRAFTALVDRYLDRMENQEDAAQGALLIIDIDHFKDINDRFGHDAGDSALVRIAETIRSSVREFDAVGRMGGEEFSVLLPSVNEERANALAESIRMRIAATELELSGRACHVSVSIGGVTFARDASFGELYRQADRKLYEAKEAGRDRTLFTTLAPAPDKVPIH